jgi:SAM-dependent methyltransferase
MNSEEYKLMYDLEDDHWWFCGKRKLIKLLIQQYYYSNKHSLTEVTGKERPLVMDIGCGTGKMLEELSQFADAIGCDYNIDAVEFCRKRGNFLLIQASAENIPLLNKSLNIVFILGVLNHREIKDDQKVLNEVFRILKPGGILIITEPALQFLYSEHDKTQHSKHRYNKREMREMLTKATFEIIKLSYYDIILFPLSFLYRMIRKIFPARQRSDIFYTPNLLNRILRSILFFEAKLLRKIDFSIGLSVFAVAQKPLEE